MPPLVYIDWFWGQWAAKTIFSFLHSMDLELFVGVVIEALETLFVWEASSETSRLDLGAIRNTLRIVLFGWVKDYKNFTTFRVGRKWRKNILQIFWCILCASQDWVLLKYEPVFYPPFEVFCVRRGLPSCKSQLVSLPNPLALQSVLGKLTRSKKPKIEHFLSTAVPSVRSLS